MNSALTAVYVLLLATLSFSFLFAGVSGLPRAIRQIRSGLNSMQWPKTPGLISVSQIQAGNMAGMGNSYTAEIVYDYRVEGQSFTGKRVSFNMPTYLSNSVKQPQELLKRYPPGRVVDVYFNKEEPGESTLETGICYKLIAVQLLLAVSGTVIGFLLMFYVISLRL